MKISDIIIAFVCGWAVNLLAFDFLKEFGVDFGLWKYLLSWVLPILSVFCLWLMSLLEQKLHIVYQGAKFALVGVFADIIDIKAFQLIILLIPADLAIKTVSFLIAVAIKYFGNKRWVFNKSEKEGIKEVAQFLAVTLGGLLINLVSFYCATNSSFQFGVSANMWTEISIIFAALAAAAWNFVGYKFIVFKK